jgi:hypothetical protein
MYISVIPIVLILERILLGLFYKCVFPVCRFTKPQTFADCIGNELPLGWEEAYDPQIGSYYINHVNREYAVTVFVNPRYCYITSIPF